MDFLRRHLFELAVAPFAVWVQWALARRLAAIAGRRWGRLAGWSGTGLMLATLALSAPWAGRLLPYSPVFVWLKAVGLAWAVCSLGGWALDALVARLTRGAKPTDPVRRKLLAAGRLAALAAPAAVLGYGTFIERRQYRLVERRIQVPGLARGLDGLRLVQLTDIHFSPFFTAADLRYAVDMANAAKPDVALITGDLISVYSDPLEECLDLLRGLRAGAGVVGCLGNHEIVAGCEDYAELHGAAAGIRFLRNRATSLRFGEAELNIAGVDYQQKGRPYLRKTAQLVKADSYNILLSHNPDVFPVAARQGWDLTVAGHTHGGQVTVEILGANANIARFYTPYVYGHYEKEGRQIYVSRGLGTIGLPTRVCAPPEVSLLTLCAT